MSRAAISPAVHVACAGVPGLLRQVAPLQAWMSAAESRRLGSLSAPGRRAQFVAGRWLMRQLLAAVYGGDALHDWPLTAATGAPPRIERAPVSVPTLSLALSHSADQVACAVAACPVGIDLELPRRRRDVIRLAGATCSLREHERLLALPESQREGHFHAMWTLKEAWLKQRSRGLDLALLPRLHTEPAMEADTAGCNAWLWRREARVLALVAPPQTRPCWVAGVSSPSFGTPTRWHVGEGSYRG